MRSRSVFGYAGSVVGDERLDVPVAPPQLHVDAAAGSDCGECVVEEVAEDSLERVGVAATVASESALRVMVARGARAWAPSTSGRAIVGEVDGHSSRVRFESGESEEVVDEAAEAFGFAGDGCFETVAVRPFGLLAQQGFDACLKRGDRGAELVGGVGKEAAGCGVAGVRVVYGSLEGVDHPVECLGKAAELGVGAAGVEAEVGVALGDPCGCLDHGGQRA